MKNKYVGERTEVGRGEERREEEEGKGEESLV